MGRVLSNGTRNPRGTIHATSGNAGPPALSECECDKRDECEVCFSQPYSYTRYACQQLLFILRNTLSTVCYARGIAD
jgi:hypothetical protein